MGKAILCIGKYAENPYYIEHAGLSVYSLEELCYYLSENIYLLDREILSMKLVEWLINECELKELGKELSLLLHKKATLGIFVSAILQGAFYYRKKELDEIEAILKENEGLSQIERKKSGADYFAKRGKVKRALAEYAKLEKEIGHSDDYLRSRVLHNMGNIYAVMFEFSKAAEYFLKSYQLSYDPNTYVAYLVSIRMKLPQEEYVRFITDDKKNYQMSMEVEKKVEQVLQAFGEYEPKKQLEEVKAFRNTQYAAEYYLQIENMVNGWKENYRNYVEE